jgi:hypothetical protein
MTLDEKIKILDKLRGDMSATERRSRELNTFASYSGGHGFKFRPETGYPDRFFVVFHVISEMDLKLKHDRFLPHPLPFIIHLSSFLSTLLTLSYRESVVK